MNIFEQIDTNMYKTLFRTITPTNTYIMIGISLFGSASVLIGITIILWLLCKNKKIPKYVTLNLVSVFILNRLIKIIVRRPRPEVVTLIRESGYSFPSAHSMISFAFYGFIIYLILKKSKLKKLKVLNSILLTLLILFIGISRVYLGVHYATDVLGGFLIALAYLIVFIKFIYEKRNKNEL